MDANKYIMHCLFEDYKNKKKENKLYSYDFSIPKIIISKYLELVEKPSFKNMISIYKRNYITCESNVEPNVSECELQGLSDVYDYILNYDFNKNQFNVFVASMMIHHRLYSHCGDGSFGGRLRESEAILKNLNIDIASPEEARKIFNEYIPKKDFILEKLKNGDTFGYIEDCIKLNADLIKLQPFGDGNKRTFRALTNLLLKPLNIPPIYIQKKERLEYKNALIKAMQDNDYSEIIGFYYYKICDSIITMDLENSKIIEDKGIQKKYTLN